MSIYTLLTMVFVIGSVFGGLALTLRYALKRPQGEENE